MPDTDPILAFEKPNFELKLYPDGLTLHVKETAIGDFEKLAEETPSLRDTLRWLVHTVVPLHVKLSDIEKVEADESGRITIKIPARKDIHIPLSLEESRKLVDKLTELIPEKREEALEKKKLAEEAKEETESRKDEAYPYIRKPA